jgi:hypothetical protein
MLMLAAASSRAVLRAGRDVAEPLVDDVPRDDGPPRGDITGRRFRYLR